MIKANKNVGETPLDLINRIRIGMPDLKNERLSYAGRLDPMAEGQMLILVGDENDDREKYLGLDKEYEAEFLVGVSTDTGDILGLITHKSMDSLLQGNDDHGVAVTALKSGIHALKENIEKIKNITEQIYPWFSGKTVNGKKLFDYFKEGKTDIERPMLNVNIKKLEIINQKIEAKSKSEIKNYIFESIGKVNGDFRQDEILEDWRKFFEFAPEEMLTFKIKLTVSSGTFIRALCEEFDFPCCLLKLKRTKIFTKE